jgi:putative Mg2+ transporter-C (MgtC) family protein
MVSLDVLSIEVKFLIGFVFCFVAGFLIGFERGSREKPAGVRTHVLVCMGAMLFTMLSTLIDPNSTSRIAANIVVGIGFLGAGIIMHYKGAILGVTTAASIWMSAAIGMTIGFGLYLVSIMATLLAFLVLRLPHFGEHGPPKIKS